MNHRTNTIPLAADEERCEPSKTCTRKSHCARYMAALPASGARMVDHSMFLFCGYFVSIEDARRAAKMPTATQRTHPPLKGLT